MKSSCIGLLFSTIYCGQAAYYSVLNTTYCIFIFFIFSSCQSLEGRIVVYGPSTVLIHGSRYLMKIKYMCKELAAINGFWSWHNKMQWDTNFLREGKYSVIDLQRETIEANLSQTMNLEFWLHQFIVGKLHVHIKGHEILTK